MFAVLENSKQILHLLSWALTEADDFDSELVIDIEQVVGVFAGIFDHLLGQGTNPSISQLILFIGKHIAILFEQKSQGKGLKLEEPGGLSCVEHIYNVNAEIPLQPLDIVISSVEDLHNAWVRKNAVQFGET